MEAVYLEHEMSEWVECSQPLSHPLGLLLRLLVAGLQSYFQIGSLLPTVVDSQLKMCLFLLALLELPLILDLVHGAVQIVKH